MVPTTQHSAELQAKTVIKSYRLRALSKGPFPILGDTSLIAPRKIEDNKNKIYYYHKSLYNQKDMLIGYYYIYYNKENSKIKYITCKEIEEL